MPDYLLFMHDDAPSEAENSDTAWSDYFAALQKHGNFEGGSAIGHGLCLRKSGDTPSITSHLTGYIRVSADDLHHAQGLVAGNPVFEAGGTIEIRELPRSDT